MRRPWVLAVAVMALTFSSPPAGAKDREADATSDVTTVTDAVRVIILRQGELDRVGSVTGGNSEAAQCVWSSAPAGFSGPDDYITAGVGPKPSDSSTLYVLFCNGDIHSYVWVAPDDIVDLDAAVAAEAGRYVEEVLAPGVSIGVNPEARGLVGVASWFWVEGFAGSVTAPPIQAFGMTVEVRLASGNVTWDFGDGTVEDGDLGQAYPAESSVQHIHQDAGEYDVTVDVELRPEYSVNGGPWSSLPSLSASATTTLEVEQRQAVIVNR